jgi:hypothetical protein
MIFLIRRNLNETQSDCARCVLAAPLAVSAQTGLFSVTPLLGYHSPDKGDAGAYVGLAAGLRIVPAVALKLNMAKPQMRIIKC